MKTLLLSLMTLSFLSSQAINKGISDEISGHKKTDVIAIFCEQMISAKRLQEIQKKLSDWREKRITEKSGDEACDLRKLATEYRLVSPQLPFFLRANL